MPYRRIVRFKYTPGRKLYRRLKPALSIKLSAGLSRNSQPLPKTGMKNRNFPSNVKALTSFGVSGFSYYVLAWKRKKSIPSNPVMLPTISYTTSP